MNSDEKSGCLDPIYLGEDAQGFDTATGNEWIYPINFPIRDYQKNIVSNALFKNTLVCLPTGLGKTFIAAVVMYNFNRWYPRHKVVFMAHSKPLVSQQVDACCKIMGIPRSVTAELNGNMSPNVRKNHWETKRIFFLTPQVFNNDLARGHVHPESIRCVVVDEAHKALGNQAYCQAVKSLQPFNKRFRMLALSATPGNDMKAVKSVIENLLISHLELRTENDPDVKKYLHSKKVETIKVELDPKILEYKEKLYSVMKKYVQPLVDCKVLSVYNLSSLTSFQLLMKQKQFLQNPSVGPEQSGIMLSNFSVVISLLKAVEELVIHGLRSFLNKLIVIKSGEGSTSKVHYRVAKDNEFLSLIESVENHIGKDEDVAFDPDKITLKQRDVNSIGPLVYSHRKFAILENVIVGHFNGCQERNESTRVIVFCKSRPCTGEICNFLSRFQPLIKPMMLIGQSGGNGSKATSRGLTQAAQLEVMRKFRLGDFNTLVATCVGEEGLDVGEVDLIINFDSGKNSNTQVQRSGRTGRKRDGRVVNLVTEGKEYQDYNSSVAKGKSINLKLLDNLKKLPLYPENLRLIPPNIKPKCQEMFLKERECPVEPASEKKTKRKETKRSPKASKRKKLKSNTPKSKTYDIRYALSQAKLKKNDFADDSSGSLFEAPIFSNSSPELRVIKDVSINANLTTGGLLAKNTTKKISSEEELTDENKSPKYFDKNWIKELETSVQFSKFNYTNEYDEAFLPMTSNKIFASSSCDENDEVIEKVKAKENVSDSTKFDDCDENVFLEVNEEKETENITKEDFNNADGNLLTLTQTLNLLEKSKRSPLRIISSSNGNCNTVERSTTTTARKCLKFTEDNSSDEDIFAQVEENLRKCQKIQQQPSLLKTSPKVAAVRPVSVADMPIINIPSSPLEEILPSNERFCSTPTQKMNVQNIQTPEAGKGDTFGRETSPSMTNPLFSKQFTQSFSNKKTSSFDCVPDDMIDILDDSFELSQQKRNEPDKSLKDSSLTKELGKNANEPIFLSSDGYESDGALEAIRAVEEFELRQKLSLTLNIQKEVTKNVPPKKDSFHLWDSDDSEVFETVRKADVKKKKDDRKPTETKPKAMKKLKKRNQKENKSNPFIMLEAEVSAGSSDESSTGLEESPDNSFLDERAICTQDSNIDMTSKYLKSLKSPRFQGKFKIPEMRSPKVDVLSQNDYDSNDDYAHDSFCVEDSPQTAHSELSTLELAEMVLEDRRKAKRKKSRSDNSAKKVKRRKRIVTLDSSSDDEEAKCKKDKNCTQVPTTSTFTEFDEDVLKMETQLMILIGSRNIVTAPEITTCLRASYKCQVEVRSAPGADFIVSWRMGINRITLSDFCNGTSSNQKLFKENVLRGKDLFKKFIIIVEDDKNKSAPVTVGYHKDMWSKVSAKRLAKLFAAEVPVLFSLSKEDTARLIYEQAKRECKEGFAVPSEWKDLSPSVETKLSFYSSLPGINIANALRLCKKYSTIASFLLTCHSAKDVKTNMGVTQETAVQIYHVLSYRMNN